MHYPAISVKFAQRVRIINWCMHKHVHCVMCWVWCVVMSCDATLSHSLSLSPGMVIDIYFCFFSDLSSPSLSLLSIWASVCTLHRLPLLTPSVSSVSCHVWLAFLCLEVYSLSIDFCLYVCRSVLPSVCRLSPPLTVFPLCACPFVHSYVFLQLPHTHIYHPLSSRMHATSPPGPVYTQSQKYK